MSKKTKVELKTQIDADIRINGNREITPPKHNSIETNIIDSHLNFKDGGYLQEVEAGYSTELSLSDNRAYAHKKYVDDLIAAIDFDDTYLRLDGANVAEKLEVTDGGSTFFKVLDTGEVLINRATAVSGTLFNIKGRGNTGATYPVYITNSDGTEMFQILDSNKTVVGPAGGTSDIFNIGDTGDTYARITTTGVSSDIGIRMYRSGAFQGGFIRDGAGSVTTFYGANITAGINIDDDNNVGFWGMDFQGGEQVIFIENAAVEPSASSASGAHLWAFDDQLKTNTDFKILAGKGLLIEDSDNPGTYVRIVYSTGGGLVVEAE